MKLTDQERRELVDQYMQNFQILGLDHLPGLLGMLIRTVEARTQARAEKAEAEAANWKKRCNRIAKGKQFYQARVKELEAELRTIDAVLTRRPALDDFDSRNDKILHAIRCARKGEDEVRKLKALLKKAGEALAYICDYALDETVGDEAAIVLAQIQEAIE